MNENLPPLPPGYGTMSGTTAYTAEQMRQYGQACWVAGRVHGQGDTKPLPDQNRLVESREKISEHVTVLHLTEEGRKCITLANEVLIPAADPVWRRT